MKPIPAIDEHGEFVEARVGHRGGEPIRIVWIHGDEVAGYPVYPINPDDYAVAYWRTEDISDWPAVRERVERSRAERDTLRRVRERAELLRYDTSALMSSPPQNAAVHDLLQILDEATR